MISSDGGVEPGRPAHYFALNQSHFPSTEPEDPASWIDGVPTDGASQSCAFCGGAPVAWVHPFDRSKTSYRVYGKGHTLPTFWTLCERCEDIYQAGDDDAAVELMKTEQDGLWKTEADVAEMIRQPVEVFRRADLGARPLK